VVDQYLLSVYEADGKVEGAPMTPEDMQSFMQGASALEDEMETTGTFVFGGALHMPDAATAGAPGSTRSSPMGHSPRPKKHIGGFYIINAESLDEALTWADKVVEATSHSIEIEVRPFRGTGRVHA
jgi:hypothetical protein